MKESGQGEPLFCTEVDYSRWRSVFWALNSVAVVSLMLTYSDPGRHPFIFSAAASWMIILIASGCTQGYRRPQELRPIHLARIERDGVIYTILGVGVLRYLLIHSPLGWLNPNVKLRDHRAGLNRITCEIQYAQAAHLFGGLGTLCFAAYHGAFGNATVAVWCTVLTVPLHVYPLMLQRWNLARVNRIVQRHGGRM